MRLCEDLRAVAAGLSVTLLTIAAEQVVAALDISAVGGAGSAVSRRARRHRLVRPSLSVRRLCHSAVTITASINGAHAYP